VTLTLGALLCAAVACATDATPAPSIIADARMQAAIERAARAQTEDEFAAQVRALAALGGANYRELIPQLVVYLLQQRDTRAASVPGAIRARLGISDIQLVEGLLPYLETSDSGQRAQLENWLGGIDSSHGESRDFSVYRRVIAARREDPPLGLVRYMYDAAADAAVATLAEVYATPERRRALFDARGPVEQALVAHRSAQLDAAQIAAARAALATLSRNPAWWVRLYAAAALAQMPELRTPALLEPLRADPHRLVRDLALRTA
jgi:hypothetical protein